MSGKALYKSACLASVAAFSSKITTTFANDIGAIINNATNIVMIENSFT